MFCILAIIANGLNAQSGPISGGGEIVSGSGSISYSTGQVAYFFFSNGVQSITQGIQQSYSIADSKADGWISLYPNPVSGDAVTLTADSKDLAKCSYQLFDVNAKLLATEKLQNRETVIPLQGLAASVYLITVSTAGHAVKTFKLVKLQ